MAVDFDPKTYWSQRLADVSGLRGVGHLEYDARYNRWLYRQKRRVLDDDEPSPAWETVRDEACAARSLDFGSPAHFLFPTAMTPLLDAFTGYGRDCFEPEASILEGAKCLSTRIHRDFEFLPGVTEVKTTIEEVFARRANSSAV